MTTKKDYYTITARLEGAWRWAIVNYIDGVSMIDLAQDVLQDKINKVLAEARLDRTAKTDEDVVLWTLGAVTLSDRDDRIVATLRRALLPVGAC